VSEWQEYAEALRQIASARESAARREDQLASERASRVSAANAAVSAAAKQRQQMEQRITELRALTGTGERDRREPPAPEQGLRERIGLGSVNTYEDVLRTAARLREQWIETSEALEEAQRRERAARDVLRDRVLTAGVLVVGALVAWLSGSWIEAVAVLAGGLAFRFVVRSWMFGAGVAVLVLLVIAGAPWWLVLPAAAVLTGVVRFVRSR
jgi:hypothetical protein